MNDHLTTPAMSAVLADDRVPHRPAPSQLLICFAAAILVMLLAQIFRLLQHDPLPWLMADYAGRLLSIGVLLALPAGRWCLRQRDLNPDRADWDSTGRIFEAGLWILAIVVLFRATPLDNIMADVLPGTVLGGYPRPTGWLYAADLTFGIALVALHEELVFRKLACHALKSILRSSVMIVIVSALIFGLYHWWRGAGSVIAATLFGLLAMPCYRRTGSLWPIGVAHYLIDVMAFA